MKENNFTQILNLLLEKKEKDSNNSGIPEIISTVNRIWSSKMEKANIEDKQNMKIYENQIFGMPSEKIIKELQVIWYEFIIDVQWKNFTKWLYSILKPYYYMPMLKTSDGSYQVVNIHILQSLATKMPWWNFSEQIWYLCKLLDFPEEISAKYSTY
ncbi:MAG: hypothetical protein ACD_4C00400G0001 [uncultured bacterium (gcode 4)]|uniref:Uncharacterized protein n=1 Tax=uncultured bacterium (gcode 4) TaxID=1234023 RepID=K2F534_9BACT|nr:MAG: hypothetical protein ACD_4C00400G0001 [uncultured bacterium (gcode 4)]